MVTSVRPSGGEGAGDEVVALLSRAAAAREAGRHLVQQARRAAVATDTLGSSSHSRCLRN
eukprot:COSAG02_NODE_17486_length_1000_cov_0.917869_1_plen_59_part_10